MSKFNHITILQGLNKTAQFFQIGILSLVIIYLPFYDVNHSFKSYINDKAFLFLMAVGLLLVIQYLILITSKQCRRTLLVSRLDIVLLAYLIYIAISKFLIAGETNIDLKFYQIIGLALLYCIIRFLPILYYKYLLGSILLSGIIQAIYGCLQLYGVYSSEHHIFKLTGSFFNPGPYAGYLAIIFSMAMALYIFIDRNKYIPHATKPDKVLWPKYVNSAFRNLNRLFCQLQKHLKWTNKSWKKSKKFVNAERLFREKTKSVIQKLFPKERIVQILRKESIAKYFSLLTLITILLVIPASKSRASWLAIIIASAYLLLILYPFRERINIIFDSIWKKAVAVSLVCVMLSASLFAIYTLKKDSADGRLLIWKVSTNMIKEKPKLGYGFNKFQAHYMDYQADYFQSNPESKDAYYADNISYPFNEYVKIFAEQGLIGLILLTSILMMIILSKAGNRNLYYMVSKAGIISLAVFAFFSYPSEILPIMVTAVILLAIAAQQSADNKSLFNIKLIGIGNRFLNALKVILSVIIISLLIKFHISIKDLYKAYNDWDEAYLLYNYEDYRSSIESYKNAADELATEGEFLIMYGKALAMAARYKKGIKILQQAEEYQTNTILYTAHGDCYSNLAEYNKAESAYLKAYYMAPNRFYPKYLLAKMHQKSGQTEKAKIIAKELLAKDVKVESTAIKEIREEMELILLEDN